MKYLYEKNKKYIKNFLNFEYTFYKFKIILFNNNILNLYKKKKFNQFFSSFKTKNSKVKIKNRCYISNNSKSVYNKFNLNRHHLRKYLLNGLVNGMIKSSW